MFFFSENIQSKQVKHLQMIKLSLDVSNKKKINKKTTIEQRIENVDYLWFWFDDISFGPFDESVVNRPIINLLTTAQRRKRDWSIKKKQPTTSLFYFLSLSIILKKKTFRKFVGLVKNQGFFFSYRVPRQFVSVIFL